MTRTTRHILSWSLALLVACAGCGVKPSASPTAPRIEKTSSGQVQVIMTASPSIVRLDADVLLNIEATAPADIQVHIPPLHDRLSGFTVAGEFDGEPVTQGGKRTIRHSVRLTPAISAEYRIAPLAIAYDKNGVTPSATAWFPTKPIVFQAAVAGHTPKDIHDIQGIVRVWPPFTTVLFYLVMTALAGVALYFAWRLARKIHRKIQLYRMSPKERALAELADLLAQHLVESGQVKAFYFSLTMIVRQYIERAHRIRAPEQTTEEFMEAVGRDIRFSPEVVARLRKFLQAADLVKYAAFRPERGTVTQAVDTARSYVETDASEEDGEAPHV
jgi:hypothetical protein